MSGSDRTSRLILKAYGWVFLLCGAAFVLLPGPLLSALDLLTEFLPGASPLPGREFSLWLGLSGSMMAMIAYLSFALARDRAQPLAWNTLLLSKGCSTALFAAFALASRNSLFLLGCLVDGAIFLHLFLLRSNAAPAGPWAPRSAGGSPCGYEVYFVKLNDPATRSALWLRYTINQGKGPPACWYVFFDAEQHQVLRGRWEEDSVEFGEGFLCRIGDSELGTAHARGAGSDAEWDLNWTPTGSPAFSFVPETLHRWGLAGTVYGSPLSLGRFTGEARIQGRRFVFRDAPGSVGHLWGSRMGETWRWAHAVFPGKNGGPDTVFEILSGKAKVGPLRTPRITTAHLWHRGRHYASTGLLRGLANSTSEHPEGWSFAVDFGELRAEGECRPAKDMTAELTYTDTDGRQLICSNSKTGEMRLTLSGAAGEEETELLTKDSAAVETVERKS